MHNPHEYSRISRTPMFEGHDIANENTNGTIGFALLVVTAGKDCSVIVGPITILVLQHIRIYAYFSKPLL